MDCGLQILQIPINQGTIFPKIKQKTALHFPYIFILKDLIVTVQRNLKCLSNKRKDAEIGSTLLELLAPTPENLTGGMV